MEWGKLVPELSVSNLDASLHFYVEASGFTIMFSRTQPAFAYLSFEGAQIMLEEVQADGWQTAELIYPFGRGINFQIECADVTALRDKLISAGYPLYRELAENWYDVEDRQFGAREFLVQDPDGYLLRFSQNLGERSGS